MSKNKFKTKKDSIRTSLILSRDHREWLRHTAFHAEITITELLKRLINNAIKSQWEVKIKNKDVQDEQSR